MRRWAMVKLRHPNVGLQYYQADDLRTQLGITTLYQFDPSAPRGEVVVASFRVVDILSFHWVGDVEVRV